MRKLVSWIVNIPTCTIAWCAKEVKRMVSPTSWIVTIATCVIALYAYGNHNLAKQTKTANEYYQQNTTEILEKMNEILKESNRIYLLIESTRNKREAQKELQKVNPQRKFNTKGR